MADARTVQVQDVSVLANKEIYFCKIMSTEELNSWNKNVILQVYKNLDGNLKATLEAGFGRVTSITE